MKSIVSKVRGFVSLLIPIVTFSMIATFPVFAQEETYDKALKAYLKKDFKTAAKHLREYVEKKPDAGAYYLLGYANYKLKHRKEAAENFREAYLIDPGFTPRGIDFGTVKKNNRR